MSPSQPFRSLQFRLAWRLALVVSAVVLATSFAILLHRRSGMTDIPREELIEAIDQVTAGLSLGSDGKPQLSLPANPEYNSAVAAADGRSLFASTRPPGEAPPGWSAGFLSEGGQAVAFRRLDSAIGQVEIRAGVDIRQRPGAGHLRG